MHFSLKDRIKRSIQTSHSSVFLRKDFDRFGPYRQVSRIISDLQEDGLISRSGYGVYTKTNSPKPDDVGHFITTVKSRLGKRTQRLVSFGSMVIQLGERQANPPSNAHNRLDDIKLVMAKEIVKRFDLQTIRLRSLENLARWEQIGAWCSALDEWREVLKNGSDEQVVSIMTGKDETSNRLRQSPPYSGLLDSQTLRQLRE